MDDTTYGSRDKAGYWKPFAAIEYPPVFVWPVQPLAILKWIPGYVLPWNALYAAIALVLWLYLSPSHETTKTFAWTWVLFIFVRNVVLVALFWPGMRARLRNEADFWPVVALLGLSLSRARGLNRNAVRQSKNDCGR